MSQGTQPAASPVLLESHEGGVLTLCLNRPERLNALNVELGSALVSGLERAADDSKTRVVVITGAGRGFCAGGDLQLLRDARLRDAGHELESLLLAGKEISLAIASIPKAVIASVNGPAAGGGMNLALSCDVRIAAENAVFSEAFAQVGLFPDFGGMFFLPRLVGASRAAELFWTGDLIPAEEALRIGLVNRVVPAERLKEETARLAEKIAAAPPLAARAVKRTLMAAAREELERTLDAEIRQQLECFNSQDCLEGLQAFFEKRKPVFRGR